MERMILAGAQSQYRLKPVDEYESQVCRNEEHLKELSHGVFFFVILATYKITF